MSFAPIGVLYRLHQEVEKPWDFKVSEKIS
jgi:hypothetical protein